MKKVITTVGTSFITNFREMNSYLEKPISETNTAKNERIKKEMRDWANQQNPEDISAEIASLLKIQEELNENVKVFLMTSDTIASLICGKAIKSFFEQLDSEFICFVKSIGKVQVKQRADFIKEGLPNLITEIENIANGYYENIIFNITGGYKGVIPFLTILASVNNCEIKYIFENSKELITIPSLPLQIDFDIFKRFYSEICLLENGIDDYKSKKDNSFQKYSLLENKGLVEEAGNLALLSPIGNIFFNRYKKQFISFFAPDNVWAEIQKQQDIKRILKEKFFTEIATKKLEKKQDHFVFDDGNNNNRIYYFIEKGKTYIYKTFENEEKAKEFINTTLDKNKIINQSTLRTIKL